MTEKPFANLRQVGGDHYKTGGTEYWDLFGVEALIFYAGRYVARWRKKNGAEDLEKALHVCEKIKEVIKVDKYRTSIDAEGFARWLPNAGDLTWVERAVLRSLLLAKRDSDIDDAVAGIKHLLATSFKVMDPAELLAKELQPKRGDHNNELHRIGASLKRGWPTHWEMALREVNQHCVHPPLQDGEVDEVIKSLKKVEDPKEIIVLDKNGTRLSAGDPCTWMRPYDNVTKDVVVWKLFENDVAIVNVDGDSARSYAQGKDLRLSKPVVSERRVPRYDTEQTKTTVPGGIIEVPPSSTASWKVDKTYRGRFCQGYAKQRVVFDRWWKILNPEFFLLRPLVNNPDDEAIPDELVSLYERVPEVSGLHILKVGMVPEEIRNTCYPRLRRVMAGDDRVGGEWGFAYHTDSLFRTVLKPEYAAWGELE
jgi:hypothetical protein